MTSPIRGTSWRGSLAAAKVRRGSAVSLLIVTASFAILLGGCSPSDDSSADISQEVKEDLSPKLTSTSNEVKEPVEPREQQVADDGIRLWGSPTASSQPVLRYLAPGAQVVFMLRLQELLAEDEGQQMLAALGPAREPFVQWIESTTALKLSEIDRLDIALYEEAGDVLETMLVVHPISPITKDELEQRSDASERMGGTRRTKRRIYQPTEAPELFAVGSPTLIEEVKELQGVAPRFVQPMETALKQADSARHINVLFATNYVRSYREALYPEYLEPLREGIDWIFGPDSEIQAGLLSLQLDERLFAELRLVGVLDRKPRVVARQFRERVDEMPRRIKDYLKQLEISPYSRDVLWDFPEMLSAVSRYTRHDGDGKQAVLRWYLPVEAAHSLVLATDLVLLETAIGGENGGTKQGVVVALTLEQRLAQPVTLSFDRDTLDNAIKSLSEEMGIKIEILGKDLELDGITKNQSFQLDEQNRPAAEILGKIMRLANPDKSATSLSSKAQKLVYVVKPKYQGGQDTILITTRAQATARGDQLPKEFLSE